MNDAKLTKLFLDEYLQGVSDLESGLFEKTAEGVRRWRTLIENSTEDMSFLEGLRRLLSARLALKGGQSQQGVEQLLQHLSTKDDFILAEAHFVRGLFYFQTEQTSKGVAEFEKAWPLYLAAGRLEKSLLARYNSYIGQVNSEKIDNLEQYGVLAELEKEALKIKAERILAWVLRQKSYLLQSEGRYAGALNFICEAAQIFRVMGPQSDYQLALLQAADCYLDLKKPLEAQMEVEKLAGTIDARVEFARDYILERLGQKTVNLQSYAVRAPFWEKKWKGRAPAELSSIAHWQIVTGELKLGSQSIVVKFNSKEGSLLQLLMQARRSKSAICEMLWPEHADIMTLDNRLHRLISRLNKKIELIGHGDGFYFLKFQIHSV